MTSALARSGLAAAAVAALLAVPADAVSAHPSDPRVSVRDVRVTVDPGDPEHPVVSYRMGCHLPLEYRSGSTFDSWVFLRQGDLWWHSHGPYEVPRDYVCGEQVTVVLTTDRPSPTDASSGPAVVTVRETVVVNGEQVTVTHRADVMLRTVTP